MEEAEFKTLQHCLKNTEEVLVIHIRTGEINGVLQKFYIVLVKNKGSYLSITPHIAKHNRLAIHDKHQLLYLPAQKEILKHVASTINFFISVNSEKPIIKMCEHYTQAKKRHTYRL